MKNHLTVIIAFLLISGTAWSQSNAILFTENGERFTAILNGVRQNDKPETNVKITGLNAEFYKLKVIFDNHALGEKNFNLYLNPGTETSYNIKKNNKGEYVIRLVSETPVAQAPPAPASQTVVVYSANPASQPSGEVTQTTTTTTRNTSNPDNISLNMGVNVNGEGGSISINASGMEEEESHSQTTVTHTTTTTHHTSAHPVPVRPPSYVEGYTGPIGCPVPMTHSEFIDLKSAISAKTFEDTRMTVAKQMLNDRCIIATQVKDVMLLFTFEDNRLQFAKYAYAHTYDVGNYYKVNDAFTFETSVEELNDFISRK